MIGVSEERDPAGIKLMSRAGLDSKQYISVSNKSTYLHAMNIETGEFVIIEKKTAEIVKSPGALAGDPGHKNNISRSL